MRSEASSTGSALRWANYLEPVSVYFTHLPAFFEKKMNLGGAAFFVDWVRLTPSQRAKQRDHWAGLGKDRDGWMPYSVKETMNDDERAAYLKSYEARLQSPAAQFHDPATDSAVQAMFDAVTRAGATPIFILPPTTSDKQYYPPPAQARNMTIWNFSDPHRYPALFAVENRVDFLHLNTAGARLFTQALAERFLELPATRSSQP
jgi:hypothetical protein